MSKPTTDPPDKGKKNMADMLRQNSTWKDELEAFESRWFRLPMFLAMKDFDLSGFTSCGGIVPLARRLVADDGKEIYRFAAQLLFRKNHADFDVDFEKSQMLKGTNGKVYHAVDEDEVWEPEKRVYLTGLPASASLDDVKETLSEYVTFSPATRKIFHLTDDMYSGQIMLVVASFVKVPPTRLYLTKGKLKGLGFTVVARGYKKSTPKGKSKKPCFCCQSLDHQVKDCPTKKSMKFTWRCVECNFSTLGCFDGQCQRKYMVNKIDEASTLALSHYPATRVHDNQRLQITSRLKDLRQTFDHKFTVLQRRLLADKKFNSDRDSVAEGYARALKRYVDRSFSLFEEQFLDTKKYDFEVFATSLDSLKKKIHAPKDMEQVTMDDD